MKDDVAALLRTIGGRLANPAPPETKGLGPPFFWESREDPQCVPRFLAAWQELGGHGHLAGTLQDARAILGGILRAEAAASAVRWNDPRLDELCGEADAAESALGCRVEPLDAGQSRADRLARVAAADAGIIWADAAIAQTGTLVHRSGRGRLKSVSLLPPVLIAFVDSASVHDILSAIVPDLGRWMSGTDPEQGIQLISGPSRSSDIENELTIGVHGPGRVHAVVVRSAPDRPEAV